MKIFHYAYWHDARFKKNVGGPIKVYELASNLTNLGHDVFLFIPRIGYPERQTSARVVSIPFLDLPVLRFICYQFLSFLYSMRMIFQHGRPDVIYVRIMWSFVPMLLGKLISVPVILEINDSPHRAYAEIKNYVKRSFVHFSDIISYHLSDHIFPVTQRIAENLHIIEGISWDKLTVLPSGTNIDLFKPLDKESCGKKLGLDVTALYVGFIGTLFRHQGIDTLIDSAPLIIQKHPDTRFLIIGDGPMRISWEKRINDNGLNSYFIFTGSIPYEDVPMYCGVMDICVAPFLREADERSPVKVFDYLACGKPVVMSNVGETSSFFSESGAVLIVVPEDHVSLAQGIIHLLETESLRMDMGKKGRVFISSRFSRIRITEMVESVILRLRKKEI